MSLLEAIKKLADENKASLNEKKGVYTFQMLVAERKTFLSKQRLEYIAKFRLDDALKELKFTEMLKETASGLVSGGSGDDISPGFGFKATKYKSGAGGREGTIEEQSELFGKRYDYQFDFKEIRKQFEELARSADYSFSYQITGLGL